MLRLPGHFTDPLLSSAQIHHVVGEPARVATIEPHTSHALQMNWAAAGEFQEFGESSRPHDTSDCDDDSFRQPGVVAMEAQPDSAALIAGDFNNIPAPRSPMFRALGEGGFQNALERASSKPTSSGNKHPIDWIFVRGRAAERQVLDTGPTSDHFPVLAGVTAAGPLPGARERTLRTETTRTP